MCGPSGQAGTEAAVLANTAPAALGRTDDSPAGESNGLPSGAPDGPTENCPSCLARRSRTVAQEVFLCVGANQFAKALNRWGPLRDPRGPYFSDLPAFYQRPLRMKKSYQTGSLIVIPKRTLIYRGSPEHMASSSKHVRRPL